MTPEPTSEVVARASAIKLICLDVDGVLTDGRIVFDSNGAESKFFHVQDGSGIRYAQRAGLMVAFITGRESPVVARRAEELGVELVYQKVKLKLPVFEELLSTLGLKPEEVLCMGDDLPDLPVMRRVGLAIAPANAVLEIKEVAHLVTARSGGHGAVREAIDWLLRSTGKWDGIMERYLK